MNDQPNFMTSMFLENWQKRCSSVCDPRLYGTYAIQKKMLSTFVIKGVPTKEDIRKIVADKSANQHILIILPYTAYQFIWKTKSQIMRRLQAEFNQYDTSNLDIEVDILYGDKTRCHTSTNSRWKFLCQAIVNNIDKYSRFKVYELGWPKVTPTGRLLRKETDLDEDEDAEVGQHEVNVQFFFNTAPERIHVEMKVDGTKSGRFANS